MRALKMLSIQKVGLLQIAICFVFFMRFSLADNFTEQSTSREKRICKYFFESMLNEQKTKKLFLKDKYNFQSSLLKNKSDRQLEV
jgi:hypothetical protein